MITRTWLVQAAGIALLFMTVWAFLNMADERLWQIPISAILALSALALAAWLAAANLSGVPRPSGLRFAGVLVCLVAFLFLLRVVDWVNDSSYTAANNIASYVTMKTKKPLSPEIVSSWLQWLRFAVQWIVLPILLIPFIARAAGVKTIRFPRWCLTYLIAFLVGAVTPHYIAHWVPKIPGFWPQILSLLVRFGIAYALVITAWVWLGRSIRTEVRK